MRSFTAFVLVVLIGVINEGCFTRPGGQDLGEGRQEIPRRRGERDQRRKPPEGGWVLPHDRHRSFPDRGDVHLKLARIYKQLNDWGTPERSYGKAVSSRPRPRSRRECYEGMTIAYAKTPNYAKVVEVGRRPPS